MFNLRLLLLLILFFLPLATFGQETINSYKPLVGIPGLDPNNLSTAGYINALYILSISVAAFLAVVRIILAGVQYMLSDVVTDKGAAKKQIQGALLGLLIVLGAVLILETINPKLTDFTALEEICSPKDSSDPNNPKPGCVFNARGGVEVISFCAATGEDGACSVSKTEAQRLREQNIEIDEDFETIELTEEEEAALNGSQGADVQGEVLKNVLEKQADYAERVCGCTFKDRQPGNPGRPTGCHGAKQVRNAEGIVTGFQCSQP